MGKQTVRLPSPSEIGSGIERGASRVIKDVQAGIRTVKNDVPVAINAVKEGFRKIKRSVGK